MITIQFTALRDGAKAPKQATPGSAGYDLFACLQAPVTILPSQTQLIPTGLAIQLPGAHLAAFLYARSGLAIKQGIVPANCVGVVDSDYRGEVCVGLHNLSDKPFTVEPGDRIAQMVIAPVQQVEFVPCESLEDSQRGTGGFGSTGINETLHGNREGLGNE